MKKNHLFFVFVLILSLSLVFGGSDSLYPQAQKTRVINPDTSNIQLSMIRVIAPTAGNMWFTGKGYEIKYQLTNIKTAHRVRLLKGGQYLGDFAGGNDIGSTTIKLGVICGKALLNGVTYGPGDDYQVEVATVDNKIKAKSEGFFRVVKTVGPVGRENVTVRPDLTVTNVKLFSQNVFKIEATVHNKGAADSPPCVLELKVGCGSFNTQTVNIPALKATIPGAWPDIKSQHTVIFTSPIALNTAMSILTVDPAKAVTESDENNNSWRKDNCIK